MSVEDDKRDALVAFVGRMRDSGIGLELKERRILRNVGAMGTDGLVRVARRKKRDGSPGSVVQERVETSVNLQSGQVSGAVRRALRWQKNHPGQRPPRHIMLFMKATDKIAADVNSRKVLR